MASRSQNGAAEMRYERRVPRSSRHSGYSLSELLVVVAIIGVMSLVAVPSFISMMNASRLKSSLRKFTSDLRGARAQAVTQYRWVKVQLETGVTPGRYTVQESADLGTTWGAPTEETLIDPVSIESTTFTDGSDADEFPEIIFRNNGTIVMEAGVTSREIVLRTTADIAKPAITVTAKPTGKITAE